MSIAKYIQPRAATQIPEPALARFLFADTRMAWLWLIVRVYVGYQWLTAGWEKLTGYDITFGATFGKAVKGGAWVFSGNDGVGLAGLSKAPSHRRKEPIRPCRVGTPGSCKPLSSHIPGSGPMWSPLVCYS